MYIIYSKIEYRAHLWLYETAHLT